MLELFAHPEWVRALGILVAATLLALGAARWLARRRRQVLMGTQWCPAPSHRSDTLLALALVAIAVALLGLRWGESVMRVPARGVDVVFLLDVSRSMDASDVPPSRLARARRGVAELLARLEPQDRAALAVFGSRGALLTPLTPDRAALLEFASSVDTDLIHPAGSQLASGLSVSLQAFTPGSDRSRVIFVLSDGEKPQRGGSADAAQAVRAQVRILAAALGTDVGASVPDHGVPLRDTAGRIVHTRRDAKRLAHLAHATDGQLFMGDAWGEFDFDTAASAIRRDAVGTHGEWVERRVPTVRVAPFAALAFALLCLEGLPGPHRVRRALTRLRRVHRRRASLALAALLVSIPMGAPNASASERTDVAALEARLLASPRDPRLLVELGRARFENGERDAAARAFTAAALLASDPHLASLAYYDLGVTSIASGDLESARDAFFDALALDPDDRHSRFNLEWTLRALEVQPPREPEMPQPARSPEHEPDPVARKQSPRASDSQASGDTPGPALDAATRARLLSRVPDDPARALRSAARPSDGERPRAGPVW
jgi:Ca-activated chloride channel family protein